jgi:hypothetical protein
VSLIVTLLSSEPTVAGLKVTSSVQLEPGLTVRGIVPHVPLPANEYALSFLSAPLAKISARCSFAKAPVGRRFSKLQTVSAHRPGEAELELQAEAMRFVGNEGVTGNIRNENTRNVLRANYEDKDSEDRGLATAAEKATSLLRLPCTCT